MLTMQEIIHTHYYCLVTEYSVGVVLANSTPNKACGVSYHMKPQAFPYK